MAPGKLNMEDILFSEPGLSVLGMTLQFLILQPLASTQFLFF